MPHHEHTDDHPEQADHHEHAEQHQHAASTDADLADLLDLDVAVLQTYWTQAFDWVGHAVGDRACRRVLDLGAGSGTGTIPLAQRFADAEVIAIDSSEEMLRRIQAKADDLGLGTRVRTIHANLDDVWPTVGSVDLTWASMSMHHMADPDRVLADIFAATPPGGLIALAEFDEPPRYLPDDLGFGRREFEVRCLDALRREHEHAVPELGSDWSPRLAAAGFGEVQERDFPFDVNGADSPAAVDYARAWLRRLRSGAGDRLEADDRETLDRLLDGEGLESLQQRGELRVRGMRTITLGRRP